MNAENLQRLERIEAHVAHLEHQVEQLNEVVVGQGKLVDHLKKQVQRQSAVLETMELERIKANNPKPPHHQGVFSKLAAARKHARLWRQLLDCAGRAQRRQRFCRGN
jgi:uncharacterized coiled-coil protein SlyX